VTRKTLAAIAAAFLIAPASGAIAQGNLASAPEDIRLDIDTRNLTFSETEYELQTGTYYRWEINHDGYEELMIMAPQLFRNSWVNQIVIADLEVHTTSFYGLEFDDEGTMLIFFLPVRPGNYPFYAAGFEDRGLSGTFIVR